MKEPAKPWETDFKLLELEKPPIKDNQIFDSSSSKSERFNLKEFYIKKLEIRV